MNRRSPRTRDRADRPLAVRRLIRDRNRKKRSPLKAVQFVLLALLVTQCLRVAFTSPRLRLQEVRVTGTQRLSVEEVMRVGNIRPGQNIFRVNIVQVSRRLLANPVLHQAVVSRELPGTLVVELRERVPALQVMDGVQVFHADQEGVVFQQADAPSWDLPRLQMLPGAIPPIGQRLRPELVRAAWDCIRLAREQRLGLQKVRVDEGGELWLNIATSPTGVSGEGTLPVRVGRFTELPEKFRDIRQTLSGWPDLTARASYLNVMCAGRPAYFRTAQARRPD